MTSTATPSRIARHLLALGLMTIAIGIALAFAAAARPNSTPVGPLPTGPSSTTTTALGQFVAVALPTARRKAGLGFVWRIARPYDSRVVREVSEANIGTNVVLVFKVVGHGRTRLIFALTRGDTSPRAVQSATHLIRAV
jgi:hypothetical protein